MASDYIQTEGWRLTFGRLLAALSPALDLVAGQPVGHAIRTTVIALRIGAGAHLSSSKLRQLYYATLLKDAGASNASSRFYQTFGDSEVEAKKAFVRIDWSNATEVARYLAEFGKHSNGLFDKVKNKVKIANDARVFWNDVVRDRASGAHDALAEIRFDAVIPACIRALDEYWDGSGGPSGLSGDSIPHLARIMSVAQYLDTAVATLGTEEAYAALTKLSARQFDPDIVDVAQSFATNAEFWMQINEDAKEALSEYEIAYIKDIEAIPNLDPVCRAFAKIADAKSDYGKQHSIRSSQYCLQIGQAMGIKQDSLRLLSRAALLHDVGKLAVPNSLLDKQQKLDDVETERLHKHPQRTLQLLSSISGFRRLAAVASSAYERLDGSGYHRGVEGDVLDMEMRILKVAVAFDTLTNDAPRRSAMSADRAFVFLENNGRARFDQKVVSAFKSAYCGTAPLPVVIESDRDVTPIRRGALSQSAA